MGLTIKGKNHSIDVGYGGFVRLRRTIASLCPDEIRVHYADLQDNYIHYVYNSDDCKKYDERTEEIYQKYRKNGYGKVIDFLYAPDGDVRLGYGTAKQLLRVIGDYDDDHIYGYAGWGPDAARFKDFRRVLEDCVENKCPLVWY